MLFLKMKSRGSLVKYLRSGEIVSDNFTANVLPSLLVNFKKNFVVFQQNHISLLDVEHFRK